MAELKEKVADAQDINTQRARELQTWKEKYQNLEKEFKNSQQNEGERIKNLLEEKQGVNAELKRAQDKVNTLESDLNNERKSRAAEASEWQQQILESQIREAKVETQIAKSQGENDLLQGIIRDKGEELQFKEHQLDELRNQSKMLSSQIEGLNVEKTKFKDQLEEEIRRKNVAKEEVERLRAHNQELTDN